MSVRLLGWTPLEWVMVHFGASEMRQNSDSLNLELNIAIQYINDEGTDMSAAGPACQMVQQNSFVIFNFM
jgi:hypothetical protein